MTVADLFAFAVSSAHLALIPRVSQISIFGRGEVIRMTVRGSYSSAVSIWVRMPFAALATWAFFDELASGTGATRIIWLPIYVFLAVFILGFRLRVTITDQWFTVKLLGFTLVKWRVEEIRDIHVIPSKYIPSYCKFLFGLYFNGPKDYTLAAGPKLISLRNARTGTKIAVSVNDPESAVALLSEVAQKQDTSNLSA